MKLNYMKVMLNEDRTPYLVKESSTYTVDKRKKFDNPEKVYELACGLECDKLAEEYVYALCLDTKCHAIGIFEVSHGGLDCSFISPREIFQKALLIGAKNIILWHNHPSGDAMPSKEDIKATRKVKEAGCLLGINLLDHIVIGDDIWHSIVEYQNI